MQDLRSPAALAALLAVLLGLAGEAVAQQPGEAPATPYVHIPIIGEFGDDVAAEGVEKALDHASRSGIRHVVFTMESPGGYVAVADQIQKAMAKHDDKLEYHCLIKQAISASVWIVYASDTIHILDGGSVGGAVVYSTSFETGNAEVDAKMNSIIAADLTAKAQAKKHPSQLVKPMILAEATLYAWQGAGGKVQLSTTKPSGIVDFLIEDTKDTVLTLTAEQAIGVGFAKRHEGGHEALGKALGLEGWKRSSDYGERAMADARKAWAAKKKKAEKTFSSLEQALGAYKVHLEEAARVDPRGATYQVSPSGHFTREALADWQSRTDRCYAAIKKGLDELAKAERHDKDLEKQGFPRQVEQKHFDEAKLRLNQELKRLKTERGRQAP